LRWASPCFFGDARPPDSWGRGGCDSLAALLVPIITEVAAERRMYLPLAALVAWSSSAPTCLAAKRCESPTQRPPVPLAGALVLCLALSCILGAVSFRRLAVYHDPITLWSDAAAKQPNDYVAQFNLAKNLGDARRVTEALDHYRRALELKPEHAPTHYNLGNLLAKMGRSSEAMAQFEEALRLKPTYAAATQQPRQLCCETTANSASHGAFPGSAPPYPVSHRSVREPGDGVRAAGKVEEAKAMAASVDRLAESNRQPELAARMRKWLQDYEQETQSAR
jgi:tetratricopeptide (TPR) repeat protein